MRNCLERNSQLGLQQASCPRLWRLQSGLGEANAYQPHQSGLKTQREFGVAEGWRDASNQIPTLRVLGLLVTVHFFVAYMNPLHTSARRRNNPKMFIIRVIYVDS